MVWNAAYQMKTEKLKAVTASTLSSSKPVAANFGRFSRSASVDTLEHQPRQLEGVENVSATQKSDKEDLKKILSHLLALSHLQAIHENFNYRFTRFLDKQQQRKQTEFRRNYNTTKFSLWIRCWSAHSSISYPHISSSSTSRMHSTQLKWKA